MGRRLQGFLLAAAASCLTLSACGPSAPAERQAAPAIRLQLLQAPATALDGWGSLRGQAVVAEFWATWCDDCVAAIPHLNKLAEGFQGRPVRFIFITNEAPAVVNKFLKTHPLRGWIGLDPDSSAFAAFGVRGIPHTVVLDPEGRVAGQTYPELLTPGMLEAVLNRPLAR